jgi:plastocyanin
MRSTLLRAFLLTAPVGAALAGCFSEKGPLENTNLGGECRFAPSSAVPGTTVIAIRNQAFLPTEVRIRTGGTVTWVNCEAVGAESHTSTADQGAWSSASLSSGDVFSLRFDQPGRFTYHCVPHPFMTAAVVVE